MKKTGLLFVATLFLSACGGGGGSSPVTMPAATPTPTAAPIQSVATQRSVASETLSVAGLSTTSFGFSSSVTGVASIGRAVQGAARTVMSGWNEGASRVTQGKRKTSAVTYSVCSNGSESATLNVSIAEMQLYVRLFYDTACTQLYQDTYLDILATSRTSASLTGNVTLTSRAGAIYDYQTLVLTIVSTSSTSGNFTILASEAPNATSAKLTSTDISCIFSATSISCGGADVTRSTALSQDIGAALNFTISSVSSRTGAPTFSVPISGTASSYSAAAGTLSLTQGTLPNWTIIGASPTDSATFNGTFVYTPSGTLSSAALSLGDTSADATVTIATSASGVITGTITQTDTGKTVATFTVDSSGNGTITYGNGSTAQIVNWNVLG